jgi:hypothetical protein
MALVKRDRVFLAMLGAVAAFAYGYAFLLETPGRVSGFGVIALAAGNACVLVLASYVLVQWYRRRFSSRGETDPGSGEP